MKNLIIVLLFLLTSTNLVAINKNIIINYDENKTEIGNSEYANQTIISSQSVADLLGDVYGNCKITFVIVNGDGETEATINIDTNTDTAQECNDLTKGLFDFLTMGME